MVQRLDCRHGHASNCQRVDHARTGAVRSGSRCIRPLPVGERGLPRRVAPAGTERAAQAAWQMARRRAHSRGAGSTAPGPAGERPFPDRSEDPGGPRRGQPGQHDRRTGVLPSVEDPLACPGRTFRTDPISCKTKGMSRRFVLSVTAAQDLDEILAYVLEKSGLAHARHVAERFHTEFGRLADAPGLGHKRDDLTSLPVLFWPVWSYLVVYQADAKPLTIVRVLHGARDIVAILGQENG